MLPICSDAGEQRAEKTNASGGDFRGSHCQLAQALLGLIDEAAMQVN